MTTNTLKNRQGLLVLALSVLMLLFVLVQFLNNETRAHLARENGEIETLTLVAYGACILMMAVMGGARFVVRYWYLPALMLMMVFRELDFDKRFTTMGILKSRFYLSPDVPFIEKLIGLLIVGFVVYLILMLLKNHLSTLIDDLRSFRLQALATGFAIAFVVISKSIDGLARKLADIHIVISEDVGTAAQVLEELLELGIPVMLMIATWLHFRKRKPSS